MRVPPKYRARIKLPSFLQRWAGLVGTIVSILDIVTRFPNTLSTRSWRRSTKWRNRGQMVTLNLISCMNTWPNLLRGTKVLLSQFVIKCLTIPYPYLKNRSLSDHNVRLWGLHIHLKGGKYTLRRGKLCERLWGQPRERTVIDGSERTANWKNL